MSFRFLRTQARCQMDCELKPHTVTHTFMIIIFSRQLTLGTEQLLGPAPPVQVARFCCQKREKSINLTEFKSISLFHIIIHLVHQKICSPDKLGSLLDEFPDPFGQCITFHSLGIEQNSIDPDVTKIVPKKENEIINVTNVILILQKIVYKKDNEITNVIINVILILQK